MLETVTRIPLGSLGIENLKKICGKMHASPMLTPILLGVLAGDAEKGRGVRSSFSFQALSDRR